MIKEIVPPVVPDEERYARLIAALLTSPGIRFSGEAYIKVQDVVMLLANEFVPEQ